MASRNASPIKINKVKVATKTTKVLKESHQAVILALPWASNSPKLGDEGGRPSPRKSKLVNAKIELLISK